MARSLRAGIPGPQPLTRAPPDRSGPGGLAGGDPETLPGLTGVRGAVSLAGDAGGLAGRHGAGHATRLRAGLGAPRPRLGGAGARPSGASAGGAGLAHRCSLRRDRLLRMWCSGWVLRMGLDRVCDRINRGEPERIPERRQRVGGTCQLPSWASCPPGKVRSRVRHYTTPARNGLHACHWPAEPSKADVGRERLAVEGAPPHARTSLRRNQSQATPRKSTIHGSGWSRPEYMSSGIRSDQNSPSHASM